MKSEMPGLLTALAARYPAQVGGLNLGQLRMGARTFDDAKITDHHAIIPTANAPAVTDVNRRVYDAIAGRTIASFYPDCEKALTHVDGSAGGVKLRAKGVRIVTPGFTSVLPAPKVALEQTLPGFVRGEQGPHKPEVHAGHTQPPKHFTDNSLLGAMETAGRLVDDQQLKEALKARGLGTPATRAAIIETLLRRNYIAREDKALRATDLGRYLVALLSDPILKSAELTGDWEAKLKEIEAGRLDAGTFMAQVEAFTRALIRASEPRPLDTGSFGQCPRCAAPITEGQRGYGCSRWRAGCAYVLWKDFEGVPITGGMARELFQRRLIGEPVQLDGHPKLLCLTDTGMVRALGIPDGGSQGRATGTGRGRGERNRSGSKPRSGKGEGTAVRAALGVCPCCGKPVVEQPKSYSCSGWASGCRFVIWKKIAGKKISAAMAASLLSKGRTRRLKGFMSKANRKFDARLRVVDGKVGFDFD